MPKFFKVPVSTSRPPWPASSAPGRLPQARETLVRSAAARRKKRCLCRATCGILGTDGKSMWFHQIPQSRDSHREDNNMVADETYPDATVDSSTPSWCHWNQSTLDRKSPPTSRRNRCRCKSRARQRKADVCCEIINLPTSFGRCPRLSIILLWKDNAQPVTASVTALPMAPFGPFLHTTRPARSSRDCVEGKRLQFPLGAAQQGLGTWWTRIDLGWGLKFTFPDTSHPCCQVWSVYQHVSSCIPKIAKVWGNILWYIYYDMLWYDKKSNNMNVHWVAWNKASSVLMVCIYQEMKYRVQLNRRCWATPAKSCVGVAISRKPPVWADCGQNMGFLKSWGDSKNTGFSYWSALLTWMILPDFCKSP